MRPDFALTVNSQLILTFLSWLFVVFILEGSGLTPLCSGVIDGRLRGPFWGARDQTQINGV